MELVVSNMFSVVLLVYEDGIRLILVDSFTCGRFVSSEAMKHSLDCLLSHLLPKLAQR